MIIPIHKKGDKTIIYHEISLSTSYKILLNPSVKVKSIHR
jgi:hypothetical protein